MAKTSSGKSKSAPAFVGPLLPPPSAFGAFALQQLAASAEAPVEAPVEAPAPSAPAPSVFAKNVPTIVVKETCNGITKPAGDTLCGQVWSKCAEITSAQGTPATAAQVLSALPSINSHTVKTQHARWRAFSGLVGRTAAPNTSAIVDAAKLAIKEVNTIDFTGLDDVKSPHDLAVWLAARAPVAKAD